MARTKQANRHDIRDKRTVIKAAQHSKVKFWLGRGAHRSLWDDRDVIVAAVAANGLNLQFIPSDAMKEDPEIVSLAVTSDGQALQYVDEKFRSDPAFVIAAVKSNGPAALQCCSEELRRDPKIVRLAVEQDGEALQYALGEQFRDDKELVLIALKNMNQKRPQMHNFFDCVSSERLKRDWDVVRTAVEHLGGWSLMYASEELRGDKEIVLKAVEKNPRALSCASSALRANREIVLKAVQTTDYNDGGRALEFASEELRGDREIAMIAIKSSHREGREHVLSVVSEALRNDREFVLQAVTIEGGSFQYVPPHLKADREIVLAALKHTSQIRTMTILEWSTEECRADRDLVRCAIERDSATLHIASTQLQLDPDTVALACDTVEKIHDFELWHRFQSKPFNPGPRGEQSKLYRLYLEQFATLYKELKNRTQERHFNVEDLNAAVQFAKKWLSESLEKKWLTREVVKVTEIPMSLVSYIGSFAGVQKDIQVAAKLVPFGSVLCYMRDGLLDGNYITNRKWDAFVTDVKQKVGLVSVSA